MNCPTFIVGDRVRMRYPVPNVSNKNGTVTMVFGSAHGFYDVKFDTTLGLRVCFADDMEHSPEELLLEGPIEALLDKIAAAIGSPPA